MEEQLWALAMEQSSEIRFTYYKSADKWQLTYLKVNGFGIVVMRQVEAESRSEAVRELVKKLELEKDEP